MAEENTRLPLLDPASLNREQVNLYERIKGEMVPWANRSGFLSETPEGRLLGPFNAFLYSPELGAAQMKYLDAERSATGLDARVREVVILTVGAFCNAAYEVYAHRAVAAAAGLAAGDIDALATGEEPKTLTSDEWIAYRFVRAVVKDHGVPAPLFAEAQQAFGHKCLVDMIHLAGLYLAVSALLNAFDVPVPQS